MCNLSLLSGTLKRGRRETSTKVAVALRAQYHIKWLSSANNSISCFNAHIIPTPARGVISTQLDLAVLRYSILCTHMSETAGLFEHFIWLIVLHQHLQSYQVDSPVCSLVTWMINALAKRCPCKRVVRSIVCYRLFFLLETFQLPSLA